MKHRSTAPISLFAFAVVILLAVGCAPRTIDKQPALQPVEWESLDGWHKDQVEQAWEPFLQTCSRLESQSAQWREICQLAQEEESPSEGEVRSFLQEHLQPFRVPAPSGTHLATGYYEPLLEASLQPSSQYPHPVHSLPQDLLRLNFPPGSDGVALRGRLDGRSVEPYWSRQQIDAGRATTAEPLAWAKDPVDLFFLHIQGSGRLQLSDGTTMAVGFHDHNGHPYRSIGSVLIRWGEIPRDQMSMQAIRTWLAENPQRRQELFHHNPRYIFFRKLAADKSPVGSAGVPLTPLRSIAVDREHIPMGTPVFIQTSHPVSAEPINTLTIAQDTGAAIKGPGRIDLFCGHGDEAEILAGHLRHPTQVYLLLPRQTDELP
ncbi:murein transglycosylase A [Desulfurispira natronophila]|uniref:peptidoglycan lytic exotransglycosylase n=1 Tax=Desulfurispira natronophila TaxID=682562 RepID=A0A7W8DGB7_9BACT|nr:MltA domain-containing protein [Desulfurispira natronophila]MBB5021194.1 membrane-bound lytic murein transglycosylase A [Desulfurispira natronophila]